MRTTKFENFFLHIILLCLFVIISCSSTYAGSGFSVMKGEVTSEVTRKKRIPAIPKAKVAIIGAGLSGLTMAHRLLKKGYPISVYEARSRVGGRVHSVYVKNSSGSYSIAELGGQNITDGGEAKHFLDLAKELNLEIEEDPRYLSRGFYTDKKFYNPVTLLTDKGFSQDHVEQVLTKLSSSTDTMKDLLELLFKDDYILKRNFGYYIGSYEGLPCGDLPITHNVNTLKYFLPGGGAASPDLAKENKPFVLKHIRGGNSKLPLALTESLENKVFVNKILQKVSRSDKEIKLEFKDGTITYCDKLVLSIPCGSFKDIFWDQSLIPEERLANISQVQYGLNGKVIILNTKDNQSPLYNSINSDHLGFFQNGDYKLLVGYTDGEWGKELTKNISTYYPSIVEMAESNYGKIENSHLPVSASEEIFKKYDTPVFKSWSEDSYAKGSYAVVGMKLGEKFLEKTLYNDISFKTIFTPINDQIYFIGEHTSLVEEGGTMEAAVESAERLANLF